jgi:hypothetical protein
MSDKAPRTMRAGALKPNAGEAGQAITPTELDNPRKQDEILGHGVTKRFKLSFGDLAVFELPVRPKNAFVRLLADVTALAIAETPGNPIVTVRVPIVIDGPKYRLEFLSYVSRASLPADEENVTAERINAIREELDGKFSIPDIQTVYSYFAQEYKIPQLVAELIKGPTENP